ncbi:MAG: TonB C-terminal domain-containing protein [Proteobacteria bacterium]|nr:TonB C-terminal domain-containing protein [Pseudomonadota bacterium]
MESNSINVDFFDSSLLEEPQPESVPSETEEPPSPTLVDEQEVDADPVDQQYLEDEVLEEDEPEPVPEEDPEPLQEEEPVDDSIAEDELQEPAEEELVEEELIEETPPEEVVEIPETQQEPIVEPDFEEENTENLLEEIEEVVSIDELQETQLERVDLDVSQVNNPPLDELEPLTSSETNEPVITEEQLIDTVAPAERFIEPVVEEVIEEEEEELPPPLLEEKVKKKVPKKKPVPKKVDKKKAKKSFKNLLTKLKKQKLENKEKVVKSNEKVVSRRRKLVQNVVARKSKIFSQNRLTAKWKSPAMSDAMLRFYMPQVNKAINPYWKIPLEMDPSLKVLVEIKVTKIGQIQSYEIMQTSGNKLLDQAVRRIFRKLKSLPPLPKGYPGQFFEFGLTFKPLQLTG